MKKLFLVTLTFLAAAGCSTPSVKKPFLWKIEKAGQTSYLFGTIHSGIVIDDLPKIVLEKLNQCSAFVSEIPFRKVSGITPATKDDRYLNKSSPRLNQLVAPRVWTELLKIRGDMSEQELANLEPEYAATLYRRILNRYFPKKRLSVEEAYRDRPSNSMDFNLAWYAHQHGKQVGFLENRTEAWFDECVHPYDTAKLEQLMFDADYVRANSPQEDWKHYEVMMQAYREGAGDRVLAAYPQSVQSIQSIACRNRHWLPLMAREHETRAPVFFAVGTAHILAPHDPLLGGLLALGFTVERIQ